MKRMYHWNKLEKKTSLKAKCKRNRKEAVLATTVSMIQDGAEIASQCMLSTHTASISRESLGVSSKQRLSLTPEEWEGNMERLSALVGPSFEHVDVDEYIAGIRG
ncbi:MAG: hypothetical protein K5787_00235 [Lentisphaeria bacterium]|nr:hypothetical protein [Lentisphaeria bacterium]